MKTTTFISLLDSEIRNCIYNEVLQALLGLGLSEEELEEAIESAMNSRLCDLEELIDIKKFL
jgi:Holliday junction resolvasome RuvABC DNA-binding subunit